MRILLSLTFGILISVALFFGMHLMISSNNKGFKKTKELPRLVYLSDREETKIEKKKRVKPKEPPKKESLKKIKIIKTNIPKVNQNVKVKPLQAKVAPRNIDISTISSLSGAQVAAPTISTPTLYDANSLQVLRKVNPKYPRRAKMRRQEGYVQLSFYISKDGVVSNVSVVASKPKGSFEKASVKAIKRWKFKPSKEAKNATITFNFRLAK